ncbi:MAG: transposase [Pseudomonadota bacterium]
MPRPLRIEYPNAWYHVMNRGAGHRDIYKNDKHREIFLNILSEVVAQFDIEIHAYCLMNNHYHLLIKTPHANLGRAMRHINGVYTQKYNSLEKTDGSLFRGRYKAIVVEEERYSLQVSRYIHLNPVEAKLTKGAGDYSWSSYCAYAGKNHDKSWLKINEILSMLNSSNNKKAYINFIDAGIDKTTRKFYENKKTPVIFGESLFKDNVLNKLKAVVIKDSTPDYNRTKNIPSMDSVESTCMVYFNVNKQQLLNNIRGKENIARKVAIYGCRVWSKEKLSIIAVRFDCKSHANISNVVSRINERIKADVSFASMIKKIQKNCNVILCHVKT